MSLIGIIASSKARGLPVAGATLWLDAADTTTISLNGSGVSQWNDKSSNAFAFTQGTLANMPQSGTQTINSKNVIDFDGSNDFLTCTAAASTFNYLHNSTGYTGFFAGQYQTPTVVNIYYNTNQTNLSNIGASLYDNGAGVVAHDVARGVSGAANATSRGAAGSTITNGANFYASVVINNTTATAADRVKIRINGGAESKTNTVTNAASSSNASFALTLGTDGSIYTNAYYGEIIFYSGQLSDTDVASVNSYLSAKWGI
jgi:hypothetical protein